MDLSSDPKRALRKLRMDGLNKLLAEAKKTLLVDVLLHQGLYHYLLLDRLNTVTQYDIQGYPRYTRYEETDTRVKYKGRDGLGENGDRYGTGDRFVCEFDGALLLGPVGPAITSQKEIIAESVAPPPLVERRVGVGLAQSMYKNGIRRTLNALSEDVTPDRHFETAALTISPWSNYYHWTVECLIRVRLLEIHGEATGTYPAVLVPEDRSSWMDETLEILDYSGPIIGFEGGIASVNTLVVPTYPDPTPAECRWLRDRMRTGGGVDISESQDRVFIARDDATVRRISNRATVNRVLNRYNIESYLLSELSVREQIELFSNAELVVAPHGAGLTNILYGDDLTVLELFGNKTVATFDRIAENMSHNYYYLQCEQDGLDIRVNARKLDETLQDILSH